ncbi:ATP-grasp domain-containing protein [Bosea sp. BK604]|uniref:ATP-grasp domain-containing protein n=1 Tax=Bosea sp. BK604 TaxID=2512180 RepID=UPI001042C525|nr:ATP-grasp domain-containing protein [Bosea sp. BK604]TCR63156.1 succinyl-CoA synthetase beta subunit [Bosea sp. BK604]
MIKLLEHEGKAILASCGVAIPAGALYRALPETLDGALVVKAQVLSGGRGKAGGIRFAEGRAEALRIAEEIAAGELAGAPIEDVYVERKLAIAQEFYLAALVDRDLGMPVLLASADGGIEIEAVAPGRLLRQPVDPLLGLQPFMVDRLVRGLGLSGEPASAFAELVGQVYHGLSAHDAELIEINPLVLTEDGAFVAADAKVVLDEDAAFRHPGRRSQPDGTAFENAARALETIGVEIAGPGGTAAIMNGAGLTMATLDEIIALDGRVSGVVELHGATMHGAARIADVLECVLTRLDPAVIMVNIHFQFRSLETIAEGVVMAMQRLPQLTPERLVLRLRGEKEPEALAILAGSGLTIIREFGPACVEAVRLARLQTAA